MEEEEGLDANLTLKRHHAKRMKDRPIMRFTQTGRALLIAGVALILGGTVMSRAAAADPRVIPVWPGTAPGSEKWRQAEVEIGRAHV